jgi:hypothetical protein
LVREQRMAQARLSTGFRPSCAVMNQSMEAVQSRCHPGSCEIEILANNGLWLAIYIKAKGNQI